MYITSVSIERYMVRLCDAQHQILGFVHAKFKGIPKAKTIKL